MVQGWRPLLLRAGAALLLLAALAWPLQACAPAALTPGPADEPQLQSVQPAAAAARSKAEQTRSDDDPAALLAALLPADTSPAAGHRAAHRLEPRRQRLTPALIHKYHGSRYKSA